MKGLWKECEEFFGNFTTGRQSILARQHQQPEESMKYFTNRKNRNYEDVESLFFKDNHGREVKQQQQVSEQPNKSFGTLQELVQIAGYINERKIMDLLMTRQAQLRGGYPTRQFIDLILKSFVENQSGEGPVANRLNLGEENQRSKDLGDKLLQALLWVLRDHNQFRKKQGQIQQEQKQLLRLLDPENHRERSQSFLDGQKVLDNMLKPLTTYMEHNNLEIENNINNIIDRIGSNEKVGKREEEKARIQKLMKQNKDLQNTLKKIASEQKEKKKLFEQQIKESKELERCLDEKYQQFLKNQKEKNFKFKSKIDKFNQLEKYLEEQLQQSKKQNILFEGRIISLEQTLSRVNSQRQLMEEESFFLKRIGIRLIFQKSSLLRQINLSKYQGPNVRHMSIFLQGGDEFDPQNDTIQ